MKRIMSLLLAVMLVCTLLPVTAQAASGDKLVALTFDDGPHKTCTKQLLNGLDELGAKVTFFMLGQCAENNMDLVRRAYDSGHEIANHTYSHPNLNEQSASGVKSQLSKTEEILNKATGTGTEYLVRPPYGNANSKVLNAMWSPAILWSVDTRDWESKNTSKVYNQIVNNASDGAIILCHDIHSTTIPAALDAIKKLQKQGYEFVTVSELFRRRGVRMEDGTKYSSCKNNGTDQGEAKTPVITYEPVSGGVRVSISSPSGAPVYYTTDGSRVTNGSKAYSGSFVAEIPCEIRAVAAYRLNGDRSDTATLKLDLMPCAIPEIQIENDQMTLTCATAGAPIYYTLDGSEPTVKSARYTAPVAVAPDTVIRVTAGGGAYAMSKELKLYYSPKCNLFADVVPGAWYVNAIDQMVTLGLMNGLGDYKFEPNSDTTRAMVVTLLYRYSGETLPEGWTKTNPFTDLEAGRWYAEAVEWGYRNGVVNGYPDNTFLPSNSITRQEMAHMMVKFLAYRGNALPAGEDCRSRFKDGSKVAAWALDSVNAVVTAGLMQGDEQGKLNPLDLATRAQFATVLMRMMDLEEQMQSDESVESSEPTEPSEPAEPSEPNEPDVPDASTDPTEGTEE